MKEYITVRELRQRIKDGRQPKEIYVNVVVPEEDAIIILKNYWDSERKQYMNGKKPLKLSALDPSDPYLIYIHHDVLDDVERQYLHNLVNPIRTSVDHIIKKYGTLFNNGKSYEQILIMIKNKKIYGDGDFYMYFPRFKVGSMYKGMDVNRKYSLEELGI